MVLDKEKIVPMAKLSSFIAWPIAGLMALVFGIINLNKWVLWQSIAAIIVGIFLLVYGIWAIKRTWPRLQK